MSSDAIRRPYQMNIVSNHSLVNQLCASSGTHPADATCTVNFVGKTPYVKPQRGLMTALLVMKGIYQNWLQAVQEDQLQSPFKVIFLKSAGTE
jgi:hypothetical protein